jgi:hypothetical protein
MSSSDDDHFPELQYQLQPGMVVTVEPGIYIPDQALPELEGLPKECRGVGMRIEDMVLILPGTEAPILRASYIRAAYHAWASCRPEGCATAQAFYDEQVQAVTGREECAGEVGGLESVNEWYTLEVIVLTASTPKIPRVIASHM